MARPNSPGIPTVEEYQETPLHPCVDNKDCDSRATCQDGKCICQGKRTGNGKYCRDSLPCSKDCGPGGTCLRERLMYKHPAECRCDKGFKKTKDGECVALAHPCKKNEDCHKKAECHRGKCHCVGRNTAGNGKYCKDSLPCPKEYEEKCKAGGNNVVSCVVDPLFPDQPECKCHLDFKTSEAGICVEITECEKNGLVCPPGKVCKTEKGKYRCACKDGYKEILQGAGNGTCRDVDECSQDACSGIKNSVCANAEGSYECECKKGFRKSDDESTCEAGANQICQEGVCSCAPGFVKNNDEECEDVDECSHNETPCGANEECLNEQGTYSCVCLSGYKKQRKVCVRKDKCNCKQHEVCLQGKCKCKEGYKKSTKGYCVPRRNIDECSQDACSGMTNSVCANAEGSYECKCKKGFRKSDDESTCEAGANQICQEGVCSCSLGFAKNNDEECEDVDECSQHETPCGANEECLNEQGTYSCVCLSGYKKQHKVCVRKDKCNCKQHEVCLQGKCKCKEGYKKSTKGYCVPRRSESFKVFVVIPFSGSLFRSLELLAYGDCAQGPPTKCSSDKPTCKAKEGKCFDGVCRCVGMYAGDGLICRKASRCSKDYKCGAGICMIDPWYPKNPFCACYPGMKKTKNGRCKAHPCKKNEDCHQKAECHRGKCHCLGKTVGNGKHCEDSLPCPKEYVEKCKAGGSNVISCVVDPLIPDQPECKCHLDFKTSEAVFLGSAVTKTFYTYVHVYFSLGFSEITECEKNGLVCPPEMVCKTENGKHRCACKDGYEEILLGAGNSTCRDIDECSQDACSGMTNSVCANAEGSYECKCKKGFRKSDDESTCEAGANQICQEGVCSCSLGFAKNNDEECEDVDECSQHETPCGANEECLNEQGTYSCVCLSGYKKQHKVCVRKDKCNCKQHEVCLQGKCKCKEGYKKSTKGYCVPRRNIDECSQDACSGMTNSVCANAEGSYECKCKKGFRKSDDESTCEAGANQICQEGVCSCSLGFAKNNDEECEDVDECSQHETPCGANEECLNEQGTYSCVCLSGYKKQHKVCVRKDKCNCKQHEVCLQGKCKCKEGYKKSTKGYCVPRRSESLKFSLGLSLHDNCFPSILFLGVLGRLAFTDFYTNKQFKAFKGLEAFNQMVSGFVTSVVGKVIAGKYVVRASVRHSPRMNDPLVNIASVLFYLEATTRIHSKLACTLIKCSWILPTYVNNVPDARAKDIDFSSTNKLKEKLDQKIEDLQQPQASKHAAASSSGTASAGASAHAARIDAFERGSGSAFMPNSTSAKLKQ
ncbi:fibrillin-1-like [Orbicella faveolata]|uniref:fibrillin-1-like n=1 Tax=Orbicella faveolata TaxID=48498 RepID=UPI0009E653A8|nr:fibrillin-1-like [Orbicella faveolata]